MTPELEAIATRDAHAFSDPPQWTSRNIGDFDRHVLLDALRAAEQREARLREALTGLVRVIGEETHDGPDSMRSGRRMIWHGAVEHAAEYATTCEWCVALAAARAALASTEEPAPTEPEAERR